MAQIMNKLIFSIEWKNDLGKKSGRLVTWGAETAQQVPPSCHTGLVQMKSVHRKLSSQGIMSTAQSNLTHHDIMVNRFCATS